MEEDKLKKLKEYLDESSDWPIVYMYKFIMPANSQCIIDVKALFKDSAEVYTKQSSGGRYISITAKEFSVNSDEIVEKYLEASKFEGVIAL